MIIRWWGKLCPIYVQVCKYARYGMNLVQKYRSSSKLYLSERYPDFWIFKGTRQDIIAVLNFQSFVVLCVCVCTHALFASSEVGFKSYIIMSENRDLEFHWACRTQYTFFSVFLNEWFHQYQTWSETYFLDSLSCIKVLNRILKNE